MGEQGSAVDAPLNCGVTSRCYIGFILNRKAVKNMEAYIVRRSDIALSDVSDTWELARIQDEDGEKTEDILAVFQTEYQIDKYCVDNCITPTRA